MTTIYYAQDVYNYSGGNKIFAVTFPYIKPEHILVTVNGQPSTGFVFNSTSQIEIQDELKEGDIVIIKRCTPIDARLVIYDNKSFLNKENQNLAQDQLFYAVQEYIDSYNLLTNDVDAVLSIILANTDKIDVDVDNMKAIAQAASEAANAAQSAAQQANTAAQTAQELAEAAKLTVDTVANGLDNKASCNLDNLSEAGLAVLGEYGGSSSTGDGVNLTVWMDE